MTGEGWRGNSFSEQWLQVSEFLDANPGSNALVFIDEVDKMLSTADAQPRWTWVPSSFVRYVDGLRPADSDGLAPGQDRALDYYREFRDYPAPVRTQAISSLAIRLLR